LQDALLQLTNKLLECCDTRFERDDPLVIGTFLIWLHCVASLQSGPSSNGSGGSCQASEINDPVLFAKSLGGRFASR
jgi:hypothetical protein